MRIEKRPLSQGKRDMMLGLIFSVFILIPLKANLFHNVSITRVLETSNTTVWF